jgi:hypothetical protein
MYIGEIESDSDWSPRRASPIDTRQKKAPEPFLRSQRAVLLRLRQELLDFTFDVTVSSRSDGDKAIPFARFIVEVQSRIERENKALGVSESTRPLFSPTDSENSQEQHWDDEGLANKKINVFA